MKSKKTDVYEIVTNRMIELLEQGNIPWQRPWTKAGIPTNLISKKSYKGINVWLLSSLYYSQNYFLSFKQVKQLGASVTKGEKANVVLFWKWFDIEDPNTKEVKRVPMLRYYKVFNIEQCTGIPENKLPPAIKREHTPIEACEKIIADMPKLPDIRHKEHRAYYQKTGDYVNMPKPKTFKSNEGYYAILFHELVHSTGHAERLNRTSVVFPDTFGTERYAMEELVAEMGASYLKSYAGIPVEQLENNAAYIQGWLSRLKNDKKFIVHASAQAQKAVDFILNVKEVERESELPEKSRNCDSSKEEIKKFNLRKHELFEARNKISPEIRVR